jgi:hypothetical protein
MAPWQRCPIQLAEKTVFLRYYLCRQPELWSKMLTNEKITEAESNAFGITPIKPRPLCQS